MRVDYEPETNSGDYCRDCEHEHCEALAPEHLEGQQLEEWVWDNFKECDRCLELNRY